MTDAPTQTRILLVEDDDQDAFLFEKMLREEAGATDIVRAVEGRGAYDAVKDEASAPDCIVLDLRLSGEDGLWLLDRLLDNEELARIPVIVFSGDTTRIQRACSEFPNVVSSVRKPETLEQYRTALTIVAATLQAALGER
ncbi:response regulator [Maricaulaceae bacterium MS644]